MYNRYWQQAPLHQMWVNSLLQAAENSTPTWCAMFDCRHIFTQRKNHCGLITSLGGTRACWLKFTMSVLKCLNVHKTIHKQMDIHKILLLPSWISAIILSSVDCRARRYSSRVSFFSRCVNYSSWVLNICLIKTPSGHLKWIGLRPC